MDLLEQIKLAYLLLKRDVYHDPGNLFLREAIARFEKGKFEEALKVCSDEIHSYLIDPDQDNNKRWFEKQLETIDTFYLPKKLSSEFNNEDRFLSNVREREEYQINELFFYFTGSIPLYIISTLWCRLVGKYLDEQLSNDCYGNRLEPIYENEAASPSYSKLFKLYYNQYERWRDNGINEGLHLLERGQNTLLIALDLRQCYHRLNVHWDIIEGIIEKLPINESVIGQNLIVALKAIHNKYHEKIKSDLVKLVFSLDEKEIPIGLPIGLPSSSVLANWELKNLDSIIKTRLRPSYYGRYVDDLLIILNVHGKDTCNQDATKTKIFEDLFIGSGIVENPYEDRYMKTPCDEEINKEEEVANSELNDYKETKNNDKDPFDGKEKEYRVCGYNNLLIQSEKTIVHYYQHDHSWAGLKEFKEEIRKRSSEFRFLPTEEEYKTLDNEAYDLHYDGSIYKLRNLIGITENHNKLIQYIYKQQLKAWLCSMKLEESTIKDLFLFYKGTNILNYLRTWEKIFTLFIITDKETQFKKFDQIISEIINKIVFVYRKKESEGKNKPPDIEYDESITQKLKRDSNHFLNIAKAMALGYIDQSLIDSFEKNKEFKELPKWFRSALLLRNQNIVWPLLDYTSYSGSLVKFNLIFNKDFDKLNEGKVNNPTRYIHPDEKLLYWSLNKISKLNKDSDNKTNILPFYSNEIVFIDRKSKDPLPAELKNEYDTLSQDLGLEWYHYDPDKSPPPIIDSLKGLHTLDFHFTKDSQKDPDKLCIGIANVKIDESRVTDCMKASSPLLDTYEKQNTLFNLINTAADTPKCDLIVFPEVYIPLGWLPFMATQARKHQMGMVFGLEHVNIGNHSLNIIATMLPYLDKKDYRKLFISLRLKNYYSPLEAYELRRLRLFKPELPFLYEKFHWHGTVFTTFNCFELTDIAHRGLFRSDIDMLVSIAYNKDINYYSNILESVARDVHCFTILSNTSDYGDSRLIAPKSTEKMNIIRVKGGENSVLLKAHLPINDLRDFQMKEFSPTDTRYKPTPAGFDHVKAKNRK